MSLVPIGPSWSSGYRLPHSRPTEVVFVLESCACPGGWRYVPAPCRGDACIGLVVYRPIPHDGPVPDGVIIYRPQSCDQCEGGVAFVPLDNVGQQTNGRNSGGSGGGGGADGDNGSVSNVSATFGSSSGAGGDNGSRQ
ncbi:hypothetical protein G7046_g3774 [Stylonectria norvegica]|nr:hypothetical protein G7046_g3774 [Stylonectria norvegica]